MSEKQEIETIVQNENALSGNSKEVYDILKPAVLELLGGRKFEAGALYPVIAQLVRIIEKISKEQKHKIDGQAKKEIALSVINQIIKDLAEIGKIDRSVSDVLLLSVNFIGPTLIDFAAIAIKKVIDVVDDLEEKCQTKCCPSFKKK